MTCQTSIYFDNQILLLFRRLSQWWVVPHGVVTHMLDCEMEVRQQTKSVE